jgi:hypothetical protein
MCLLRLFEQFSQFLGTAQDRIIYINVATDLCDETMTSFGNKTLIGSTVILRAYSETVGEELSA